MQTNKRIKFKKQKIVVKRIALNWSTAVSANKCRIVKQPEKKRVKGVNRIKKNNQQQKRVEIQFITEKKQKMHKRGRRTKTEWNHLRNNIKNPE